MPWPRWSCVTISAVILPNESRCKSGAMCIPRRPTAWPSISARKTRSEVEPSSRDRRSRTWLPSTVQPSSRRSAVTDRASEGPASRISTSGFILIPARLRQPQTSCESGLRQSALHVAPLPRRPLLGSCYSKDRGNAVRMEPGGVNVDCVRWLLPGNGCPAELIRCFGAPFQT